MKVSKWIFCIISTLLIIAYLIYIPTYILDNIDRNEYLEMLTEEPEPYTGVLELWHIVGFKPSIGSLSTWLSEIAKSIESAHFGVYINVTAMTLEECEVRMARGEWADIYSYPMGWGYAELFQPLSVELPALAGDAAGCGVYEENLLSVPYVMSGYLLAWNYLLLVEQGVEIPEIVDTAWIRESAGKMYYTYGKNRQMYGLSGSAVMAAYLGIETDLAELDLFKNRQAAMAICDVRTVGELSRAQLAGKSFYLQAAPVSTFTDLVQLIGIDKRMDAEKLSYAMEFIDMLYREKNQLSLVDLGLFPIIERVEDPEYAEDYLAALYILLREPVLPNAFLYQRYQAALVEAALRAVAGEETAKTDFDTRIKELVSACQNE